MADCKVRTEFLQSLVKHFDGLRLNEFDAKTFANLVDRPTIP